MRIHVINHWSDDEQVIEAKNERVLCHKLEEAFPWLATGNAEHHGDLEGLLEHLNSSGGYEAEILNDSGHEEGLSKSEKDNLIDGGDAPSSSSADMAGYNPTYHKAFKAVQFLTGKPEISHQAARQALYHNDDAIDAALAAYGMEINEAHRRATMSAMGMVDFGKAKATEIPKGETILPGTPDSTETATAVSRAFATGNVKAATVDGKHSKGSLIAKDEKDDRIFFLKPGSGGDSPAAGVSQEHASQSRREAAYWRIADAWDLAHSVPRTDLVIIDGKEYAAIHMVPFTWQGLEKKSKGDYNMARVVFEPYRNRGTLAKWAVMDFVLGNPDRHADNVMVSDNLKMAGLIDHGSAFAGDGFNPAHDKNSFVPFYLRAWSGPNFNKLPTEKKLEVMPRAPSGLQDELQSWLGDIHADQIQAVCHQLGIDPAPSLKRLARVKALATAMPVDQAANRVWVL